VTPDGSLLLTGQLQGACLFGMGQPYQTLRSSYSLRQPDMFLARYRQEDGDVVWARTGRGPGTNWGSSIAAVAPDRVVVTGGLNGPLSLGEGEAGQKVLSTRGRLDRGAVFVANYFLRGRDP
jgi:hypothetical protein